MFYKVKNVYLFFFSSISILEIRRKKKLGSKQGKGLHKSVYAFSNEDVESWSN